MSVELNERRQLVLGGGGEDRVAKQHEAGKLTARERVNKLFDEGKVLSASVVKEGGAAASVCKACFGNGYGLNLQINSQMTSFSPLFQVHLFLSLQTVRNLTTV